MTALAILLTTQLTHLAPIDILILVLYFVVVLFIGFYVKGSTRTSEEFFLAGREMTAWIAGLSFVSANLGSLELMGWAGAAYQYGMLATHWYWIGAIPAMLFLGIVMMPFYYISKTHSVPGYLQLRFGEGARGVSAVSFAFMTILMSGVNMYSMALVMKVVLGWNISFSIWIGAVTVAIYVMLGGLRSAIINEVLQFVLIWAGAALIPILGLWEAGGWTKLKAQIAVNVGSNDYTHLWTTLGSFKDNPMGVHWTGIVFGLGFVISFGYWTTDFLVVQRVLSANNLRAAKMAPVIGAAFKMAVPFIVIVPGLLALAVLRDPHTHQIIRLVGENQVDAAHPYSYNEVLPLMLIRYCGPGLLGLGITALIAGFMSGMAGNVSAFSTVWTYDLYGAFFNKKASDKHYVSMGRWSTVVGMIASIGTAYLVMHAASIMDYVQALFSFFIAPLFGTVILGMLWKRATRSGGFWGLLAGTVSSIAMWLYTTYGGQQALAHIALSLDAKPMAENLYRAFWSWLICVVVTVSVSLVTRPVPEAQLAGLVYGATTIPDDGARSLWQKPIFWAAIVITIFFLLNIIFF
ncbi:sodium:solute symporter family protein [Tunturiibacter gelidoferens]|uniref:SSS family solute:Na+ symporter n=2 Tax=Tunturiibacter TaxID=3154218 RepID=A0A7Y9NLW7_9BACT|nr:sodium:solute symporter family protein [Edaphobacter lichenicola]MBB5338969.1 SSS family solute:Na+ symporter [Edaphobacter lichenicola]NYF51799.1 SSS family solute:Na+ symporter [Edaphobacter lichenicola]